MHVIITLYFVFCTATSVCKPVCGGQNMAWSLHSHYWQIMHKATSKNIWLTEERESQEIDKLKLSNSSPPAFSLKMFYVVTGAYMSKKINPVWLLDNSLLSYIERWRSSHTHEKMKIRHYNSAENYFIKPPEILILPLKHWIHFRRSSRCPPTSNILKKNINQLVRIILCWDFCLCLHANRKGKKL